MKLEFISSPDCSGKPAKFEACKTQVPKRPAGALGTPMFCRMKTADLKRKAGSWLQKQLGETQTKAKCMEVERLKFFIST